MALQALLLSRDPNVQNIVDCALDQVNIDLHICATDQEARSLLNRSKYDAFILDCDDTDCDDTDCDGSPNALAALEALRAGKSNKSCITFVVVNGGTTVHQAFAKGANFVLDKPLSLDRVIRSLRAARGLILRERRRYHRFLVDATGAILVDAGAELPITITNISEGGISLECTRQLDMGGAANLKFILPGTVKMLDVKGEIIWATIEGKAGIRFQVLPLETKRALDEWLDQRALTLGDVFIDATATPA